MKYYKLSQTADEFIELSVQSFEKDTKESHPYYQTIGDKKRYFAYCPGCSNPITIINLYNDGKTEENGSAMPLHGRHYQYSIKDFGPYDEENYLSCPFSKPLSFSGNAKRGSGKDSEHLKKIILEHSETLYSFAKSICGINLSENLFDRMLKNFKQAEGIYYRHINKFNLPYAFLHMAHSTNISHQFIENTEIVEKIQNKSLFFTAKNGQIIPKEKLQDRPSINMYFTDHKFTTDENDESAHSFKQIIMEKDKNTENTILERTILFDNYFFYRVINKNNRLRQISRDTFDS